MNSLSWHLNININDINTLFKNQTLPYEVDCFICLCGKFEFIIKETIKTLDNYICEECGNELFLDANKYNNNYLWYEDIEDLFNEDFLLSLAPYIEYNEEKKELYSGISINIPSSFDLVSEKIKYTKKNMFELVLDETNKFQYKINANFNLKKNYDEYDYYFLLNENDLIDKNLYLSNYKLKILKQLQNLSKSKVLKKCKDLKEFEFFFNKSHLKNNEFYKWQNTDILPSNSDLDIEDALEFVLDYRKEKTLRKSIFLNYKNQLKIYSSYNLIFPYTLSRCIEDVNILNMMLEIDLYQHFSYLNSHYSFYKYVKFLKTRFTDKQLENLLKSYEKEELFWLVDTVSIFSEIEENIEELPKIKCNIYELHDAIIELHQLMLQKELFDTKFSYDDKFLNACVDIQEFQVRLPKNGKELYQWSKLLENCLSGYGRLIRSGKTTVYGFFKNEELKFAVEIRDNKIVQSKSKYNQNLKDKEVSLVSGWFNHL